MLFGFPYYLILVIPLGGSLLVPLAGRFSAKLRDWLPAILMGVSMVFCWSLVGDIGNTQQTSWVWISSLGLNFDVLIDPLSVLMAILSSTLCFLIYVYSTEYMAHEGDRDRFFFLMLAFGGGMLTLVLSNSLLIAFVGWEIMGFCSYGLIGFWNDRKNPPESDPTDVVYGNPLMKFQTEGQYNTHCGTKAFIVTRVGDAFMLAGILLLFAFSGTFSFSGSESLATNSGQWWETMASAGLLIPVLLLIFLGAIGKSGQVPLQVWLPEAMAGPTSVSALIHAATMVKAGVYITARFLLTMASAAGEGHLVPESFVPLQSFGLEMAFSFFVIVGVIGGITAFMTATMGMVSNELKQILAFSTLSQLGYMMLALGTGGMLASEYGLPYVSGILHVVSHGAFKALLFLAAGGVIHVVHSKYITRMGGLKKHMRKTWAVMWIGVLALAGVFPLSGFWSKDSIIEYAYELALLQPVGVVLFVLSVAAAACTIFYGIRLMGRVFYGAEASHESESEEILSSSEEETHRAAPHDPGPAMMVPLYILAAFTLVAVFVFPFIEALLSEAGPMTAAQYQEMFIEMWAAKVSPEGIVPFVVTLVALALGGIPAYTIYIRHADHPNTIIPERGLLRSVHGFLRHRWYINELYYRVVGGFLSLAESWRVRFDNRIIDGIDFGSARAGRYVSGRIRWFDDHIVDGLAERISTRSVESSETGQVIQTGRVNDYVAMMIFGLGLIIIVMLLALGVI